MFHLCVAAFWPQTKRLLVEGGFVALWVFVGSCACSALAVDALADSVVMIPSSSAAAALAPVDAGGIVMVRSLPVVATVRPVPAVVASVSASLPVSVSSFAGPSFGSGRVRYVREEGGAPSRTASLGAGKKDAFSVPSSGSGMVMRFSRAPAAAVSSSSAGSRSGVPLTPGGNWSELKRYHVIVHADNRPLRGLLEDVLRSAEPFVGTWKVKWKLKPENEDVLTQKFSLDAETTFDEFVSYVSNFMVNYRGFPLVFEAFEGDRVLVVSDH